MRIDDTTIRKYLLGSASEMEDELIGVRLLSDEEFGYYVEHIESDLIEDHLDGALSPAEQALFQRNFLVSERRRDLIRQISLLRAAAAEYGASHKGKPGTDAIGAIAAVKTGKAGFFSFLARPAFAGAAAAFLILAAFLSWFVYFRDTRSPLEAEYAALNRRDLGDPARTQPLFALNLISGNLRGTAGAAVYSSAGLTDSVLIRLALPEPATDGSEMKASIERAGKTAFRVDTARVFQHPNGAELRFIAPKQALSPGQYQISITDPDGRFSNLYFQFRID